jgi:hypothetical protein
MKAVTLHITVSRSPRPESRRRQARGPAGMSFWGDLAGEERRRPPQDLVLLFQRLVPLPQLAQLCGLAAGHARADAVIDISKPEPAVQARLRDPEVLSDLGQRRLALTGDRDHVPADSGGNAFGMMTILPARRESSQARSQPRRGQSPSSGHSDYEDNP